jgi:hypothetical protein
MKPMPGSGIKCCKDCTKRYPLCQDSCEELLKEKAELEEIRKKRAEQYEVSSYFVMIIEKQRRISRNHKRGKS